MTDQFKNQFKTPPYLKRGDTVAITCPAKNLPISIREAVKLLESWGLNVLLGETVGASWHQFAGNDELRTNDFQRFLDDANVKAIFAARGGYGTVRIIDRLDFSSFSIHPKWIVGFSDITVLHSHIQALYKTESIHGQMPLTIPEGSEVSLESLRKVLFNEPVEYSYKSNVKNKPGNNSGILIGGNLTLLVMMSGSISEQDYTDKILFIEDVGEYLYSVDRMMWNLKRSGKLDNLKGLIVGSFTEMKDNDIPFGLNAEQIIMEHVKEFHYPVCFNFPAGHITDNRALILGRKVSIQVEEYEAKVIYSNNIC